MSISVVTSQSMQNDHRNRCERSSDSGRPVPIMDDSSPALSRTFEWVRWHRIVITLKIREASVDMMRDCVIHQTERTGGTSGMLRPFSQSFNAGIGW